MSQRQARIAFTGTIGRSVMNAAVQGETNAPPLVTVILPVFNGAVTIEETIASVLGQSLSDLELMVIDDGSTDSTREIVARCGDARLQFHTFENRGPSACRNRGIRLSRSRYVAFIDADDLWTPDKLAKQVAALEAEPAAALVYSLTDLIDEKGRFLGPGSHRRESGEVYERLLVSNFLENGSTPLLRREVFDRVGLFDESLRMAEDWELWLRIAEKYPFACVPEAQVRYRIHAGATTSGKLRRLEEGCLHVLRGGLERLPPSPQRDRLEREALAILYRSFTSRVVVTATSHRAVLLAYRYLWRYVTLGGLRWSELVWAGVYLGRALALTLLPFPIARPLLAGTKSTIQLLGWGR